MIGQKIILLNFIRDIGKHISVNYMMAKDSVKNVWKRGYLLLNFHTNYYKLLIICICINIKIADCKWAVQINGKHYYRHGIDT